MSCHESNKAEANQIPPLVPLELELLQRRFLYAAACANILRKTTKSLSVSPPEEEEQEDCKEDE